LTEQKGGGEDAGGRPEYDRRRLAQAAYVHDKKGARHLSHGRRKRGKAG